MAANSLSSIGAVKAARALGNLELAVLNAVEQAVIATDLEGQIIFWNRFAERLYGWRAEEVLGQNILDVTPNTESRGSAERIFERLKRGESWSGQFGVRDKSGRWFRVEIADTPIYAEDGTIAGIVGISKRSTASLGGVRPSHVLRDFLHGLRRAVPIKALSGASAIPVDAQAAAAPRFAASLSKKTVESFLIALLAVVLAVAARYSLDGIIPGRLPFITFFPAVFGAAYFCGLWSTTFVVLALAAIGAFWNDVPANGAVPFRVWSFVLFAAFGAANAGLILYLKYLLFRLKERDEQLALINHELHHRIKNLFAIVSSICMRTLRRGTPSPDISRVIVGRISAVASAQQLLNVMAAEGSDLHSLVAAVVAPIAASPTRLMMNGPHVTLPQRDTTSFALILHELATNAIKHGAWSSDKGEVAISWDVLSGRELHFHWREREGPQPASASREGFGSELIKRALSSAEVEHVLRPEGLDCQIRLPLR